MASKSEEIAVNAPSSMGLPAEGFEWETVHYEAPDQIVLDAIGDTFIGQYTTREIIEFDRTNSKTGDVTRETFVQYGFNVGDTRFVINGGYDLDVAFGDPDNGGIPFKSVVRLQLLNLVDVGQQSDMKSYRVDVARNTGPTA